MKRKILQTGKLKFINLHKTLMLRNVAHVAQKITSVILKVNV